MPESKITVFHVSPIYNRASILKHGIVPTPVHNSTHLEVMKENALTTEDGRATYTWIDSQKNSKYIRDLIYAITWIHPRNEIAGYVEKKYNDWIKFHDVDHRRPIWKYDQMIFDVYAANVEHNDDFDFYHIQEPSPNTDNSAALMHDEFAHDDKQLAIFSKPLRELRIVGQAIYRYDSPNDSFTIKTM